jgi:hypothetical protein
MAWTPCPVGNHRYTGKAASAYVGVGNGIEMARTIVRLCPTHWARYKTENIDRMHDVDRDGDGLADLLRTCVICGAVEALDKFDGVFVTYYEPKRERADAFGLVCATCEPQLVEKLFLSPLAGPTEPV